MATKVHKVGYYNPKPKSINCVSLNKVSKLVAVAREDASIEIWDLAYCPYLVKHIPGTENGSVEALGWINDRLLSTGIGGALVEWDLDKLVIKTTILLTGYAAWCLDVNSANTFVAVGTEQGYVNLYLVVGNDIVYEKLFDKQEGRIMCCKFDGTGNFLVTGSVDTIRVWNVATGQPTTRMSARRRGIETIVWCLGVLSDNTVVSGESHGRLTFWDISTGDQIESFTTHKSDILSIVISEDEKSLFCSGLDPIIANFIKVENSKKNSNCQWMKNIERHIHEHCVRGLALLGEKLLSVGVDGYMTLSSFPPKWIMRIPPMLPSKRSSVSALKKLLLLKYNNHLEVWKLGSCAIQENSAINSTNTVQRLTPNKSSRLEEDSETALGATNQANINEVRDQTLQITENTTKLVTVNSKKKKQITCCGLSPDGNFMIYSTESDIRMLKLESDDEANTISLSKVLISGMTATSCDRVAFTADSSHLLIHSAGTVYFFRIDDEAGAVLLQSISTSKYLKSSLLHLLISKVSRSGIATYVVVAADTECSVAVWCKSKKAEFKHYVSLPKYKCVPSAMTIDERRELIVAVYVDQKIIEYDLAKKKFNDWTNRQLPPEWYARESAVRAVLVHPTRDALVFQDEASLWILEKNSKKANGEPAHKRKPGSCNASLRQIPVKYLSDFHWLGQDEAVMIEILPENIVAQLPQITHKKKKPYIEK